MKPSIDTQRQSQFGDQRRQALDNNNWGVTTKDAARLLGLSHKTLNNWRVQGQGPRFLKYGQRGGAVRYLVADLHAWREAQARSSTSSI